MGNPLFFAETAAGVMPWRSEVKGVPGVRPGDESKGAASPPTVSVAVRPCLRGNHLTREGNAGYFLHDFPGRALENTGLLG